MSIERDIFKRRSRTFYSSSLLFPKEVRQDIFDLYSFLRIADDYVDRVPSDVRSFDDLKSSWLAGVDGRKQKEGNGPQSAINREVVKNILRLTKKYDFDTKWVDAFFDSMKADIDGKRYDTLDDTLNYTYGSAEVVGLMMARIMEIPDDICSSARVQGRAFQWINFIRDIEEDNRLGRLYFSGDELKQFNLPDISRETASQQPEDFGDFIRYQLARYKQWQLEAEAVYGQIPDKFLMPLQAANYRYDKVARELTAEPLHVFRQV